MKIEVDLIFVKVKPFGQLAVFSTGNAFDDNGLFPTGFKGQVASGNRGHQPNTFAQTADFNIRYLFRIGVPDSFVRYPGGKFFVTLNDYGHIPTNKNS